ncbi:MAG: hypothetical protein ISS79_01660 [Phycisphaerae bacterium]|nr:hypothetical protein [Phycisphaerae bacterium]
MWWVAIPLTVVPVFFLVYFRREVRGFVNRLRTVKYRGTELTVGTPEQHAADVKEDAVAERLMQALDSPALRDTEKLIDSVLESLGVGEGVERAKVLKRYLAAAELQVRILQIDAAIWGSQIYLLEFLNERQAVGGASLEELRSFYDNAAARYPEVFRAYSYEAYMRFLTLSNIIIERGGKILITTLGTEFLAYLVRAGKSSARFRPG